MGGRGGGSSVRSPIVVAQQSIAQQNELADLDIIDAFQDVVNITNARGFDLGNPMVSIQRLRTALVTRGWSRERQDEQLRRFINEGKGRAVGVPDEREQTESFKQSALRVANRNTFNFTILEKTYKAT